MNYYGKNMVCRYEQVELFSPAEYRRRINGVVQLMKQRGVQVVLFPECAEETYDHWLTGRTPLDLVAVLEDGSCFGVLYSELDESGLPEGPTDYGRYHMQRQAYEVPCDGVEFINRLPDERLADLIAAARPERIGLVLPDHLNAGLYDALTARLPGVEFVDLTLDIALFKAVKSDEEVYAIRQSATVQKKVFDALPQMLRLGRSVRDVDREIAYYLNELGCSGVVHGGVHYKGNMDTPAIGMGGQNPDALLRPSDRVFVMFEANGPGHQHVAFGRHFVFGEPSEEFAKAIAFAVRSHQFAVDLMKPDSLTLAQIAVKTRKFCNRNGYELMERVGWNWMHSMGAYYYEQYSLEDYSEDEPLRSNILLHCHPVTFRTYPNIDPNLREDQFVLNTYLITDQGAQDLSGIPLDLIVL